MSEIRFAVNLSILFTELPLLRRPAAAAAAGFDAVELWWPFEHPTPTDAEADALLGALDEAGVLLSGLNFYAGNMAGGDRGVLSDPGRAALFQENIDAALGIADATGCRVLNALYGNRVEGVSPAEQDELAVGMLRTAAEAAALIDATVVIEPLNTAENPRYPITTAAQARAICERTDTLLLCDLYHLARNGEDLPATLAEHIDVIGHVQLADTPGRNRPGTGDLDVGGLLGQLERLGYPGRVGLEYKPLGPSASEFDWLPRTSRSSRERSQS